MSTNMNMTTDTSTNMSMTTSMITDTIMDTITSTSTATDTITTTITDMITSTTTATGMTMATIMIMTMEPKKLTTTASMSWRIITLPIPMKRMWQAIRTNAAARPAIPTKSTAIIAGRAWPTASAVCRTRTMSSAFTN